MGGLQTAHSSVVGDALKVGFQNFVDQSATLTATTGTPSTGQFRSSIIGRASIPDLANDLRVSFGNERISTQGLVHLQNEFGANGEPVYAVLNDDRGLIRFVGNWTPSSLLEGASIISNTSGSYLEVTFYGTGLNLLALPHSTGHVVALYVDNNLITSNIFSPISYSSVLASRSCAAIQVVPVTSNLSLGLHTLRLVTSGGPNFYVSGIEVIGGNTVNINAGTAYIQGQKVTKATSSSIAYNTGVTGTKGGRIVRYLNADGNVSQAFTAVDASAAYLALADHTNEEIVRTYNFRELGCGRSDLLDFSSFTTNRTAIFTLDDGTTTLVSDNAFDPTSNGVANLMAYATGFIVFTFVGTGIDFNHSSNVNPTAYTLSIDGVSLGTVNAPGVAKRFTQKVVSGLPYGTHTVKLAANSGNGTTGIVSFAVYQPKKPTIPTTAVELCDYNVMGNFVAPTGNAYFIPAPGVLRKLSLREYVYVGAWNSPTAQVSAFNSGFNLYTTTVGDPVAKTGTYFSYTFFGNGFDFKFINGSSSSTTIQIAVDGSSNLASFTTGFYGSNVASFTASTGRAVTNTTSGSLGGVYVNGLSLGPHTITVAYISGSALYADTIDVITPIHSHKSNLFADLQNTLTVGSNSLMDSRKTSMIKESIPAQKAWAQAIGVSNPTSISTTSTSYVPMSDMSLTLKTNGGSIEIEAEACVSFSASGNYVVFGIHMDGVLVSNNQILQAAANSTLSTFLKTIVPAAAGVHKIDLYWKTPGGVAASAYHDANGGRVLTAKEL